MKTYCEHTLFPYHAVAPHFSSRSAGHVQGIVFALTCIVDFNKNLLPNYVAYFGGIYIGPSGQITKLISE